MAILKRQTKRGVRYQVVVDRRDPLTGKRNRATVGTYSTKKEAQRAERTALDAIDGNRYVERSTLTVADLMHDWLTNKRRMVSAQTAAGYEQMVNLHVLPHIGSSYVQKIKPLHIQRWIDTLDTGDRTREQAFGTVRMAFQFAVQMGTLPTSPCMNVKVKRSVPSRPVIWDDDQLRTFLELAEDDTYGALWHLLCKTGMRFSEAAGLRWQDIDWDTRSIKVQQVVVVDKANHSKPIIKSSPKTQAGRRIITVSARTVEYLQSCKRKQNEARLSAVEWHDNDLITCYHDGRPVTHSGMRRKLITLCKAAGVPVIPPHAIRHLHATNLARAGVPLRVSMERMGHASPDVLLGIYQHVDQEMRADVVEKMDKLLG